MYIMYDTADGLLGRIVCAAQASSSSNLWVLVACMSYSNSGWVVTICLMSQAAGLGFVRLSA